MMAASIQLLTSKAQLQIYREMNKESNFLTSDVLLPTTTADLGIRLLSVSLFLHK